MKDSDLNQLIARTLEGGAQKYHQKNAETGKLFARERIARLFDPGSFVEDALLANAIAGDLPADGPNNRQICGTSPLSDTWL